MFWYGHQRLFHFIEYIDTGLLWSNLIFLMLVALASFTTNLAGDYINFQMGILPMEIQFLIMNLIYSYMWLYVISKPEMLSHELKSLEVAKIKAKQTVQIVYGLGGHMHFFLQHNMESTADYPLVIYLHKQ